MNEDNRQEYIELYLLGKLEGQALRDFEHALETDQTLQMDVTLSKEVQEALNSVQAEQLFANKLSPLGDKYVTESLLSEDKSIEDNASTSNSRRNIIIIVVSILTALAVLGVWWQQNVQEEVEEVKEIESEQIFASYYQPYPSNTATRSSDGVDEAYQNAVKAYDEGRYADAIESLTQRVVAKPDDIPTQLLLGNSYLNVSPPKTQKAIEVFQQIATGDSVYVTTAKWYLALTHLQASEAEKAKIIFEDLSKNTTGRYANLAKEILKDWR